MKYQFVAGLHGNEIAPVLALAEGGVSFVVGNPRALQMGKRWVDRDLNKSFGLEGNEYEVERAKKLLSRISIKKPVVDFHTFTADSPPFVVVVDLEMLPLAQMTGVKRVVYMKHNIKAGHALIDHRKGISVEVGQHGDPVSLERTLGVVESFKKGKKWEVELYEAVGVYDKPGNYLNFEKYRDGSFPVLAGKNKYDHFGIRTKYVKSVAK